MLVVVLWLVTRLIDKAFQEAAKKSVKLIRKGRLMEHKCDPEMHYEHMICESCGYKEVYLIGGISGEDSRGIEQDVECFKCKNCGDEWAE